MSTPPLSSHGSDPQGATSPVVPPGRAAPDALRPPPPPSATRLNKMGVIVAAVIMSVTLIVAAFLIGREPAPELGEEASAARFRAGAGRSFLDRPAPEPAPAGLASLSDSLPAPASVAARAAAAPVPYGPAPYEPYSPTPPPSPSPEASALEAAMRSGLTARSGPGGPPARAPASGGAAFGASEDERLQAYLQQLDALRQGAALSTGAVPGGGPGGGERDAPRAETFAAEAARARTHRASRIATEIERPAHPHEVREGTLVEAFLLTAIHSDLPGEALAQVARNVYDSQTQQVLLIPKGSRLIGTYDNQVALGQGRLLVAWTRLVFPDGRSVDLPGLASKDPAGATGLAGHVSRHRWRAFGGAVMLGVVGGGLAYAASRGRSPSGVVGYPGPGDIAAASVGTELSRVATEVLRRDVNRRPTIRAREGARFGVFMNGDLALPPYAAEDGFMQAPPLRQVAAPPLLGNR